MWFLALLWASPASACSFLSDDEHVVDTTTTNGDAPAAPEIGEVTIGRGNGPQRAGCSQMVTSCDDAGWLQIAVSATDDFTLSEEIGFRVELVEGDLPDGFAFDGVARRARDGALHFHWNDEATDEQEAFDFTVSIVAIDLAGNESEPVELDVSDPGSEERGCSHTGGSWLALGPAGLVAAALRRRRR
jgi:MYXO-CTERM domain-containing protein